MTPTASSRYTRTDAHRSMRKLGQDLHKVKTDKPQHGEKEAGTKSHL